MNRRLFFASALSATASYGAAAAGGKVMIAGLGEWDYLKTAAAQAGASIVDGAEVDERMVNTGCVGVFGGIYWEPDNFEALHEFIEKGGRGVLYVSPLHSNKFNNVFAELFGIRVMQAPQTQGLFTTGIPVSPRDLAGISIWQGCRLGFGKKAEGYEGYFAPSPDYRERCMATQEDSGRSLCIAARRSLGKGEVLFLMTVQALMPSQTHFSDEHIVRLDGEKAALMMFRWLGRSA